MTAPDSGPSSRPLHTFAIVVAASVALGVLGGVVWGLLAPAEQFVVVAPGRGAALTGESLHRFDSVGLFLCIVIAASIVLPVGFWTWTARRGPVLTLSLLLGSVLGSGATLGIGVWVAGAMHDRSEDQPVGSVVAMAPELETPLVLIVQALVTSLIIVLLAAMNPHDNLRFSTDPDPDQDAEVEGVAGAGVGGERSAYAAGDEQSGLTGRP